MTYYLLPLVIERLDTLGLGQCRVGRLRNGSNLSATALVVLVDCEYTIYLDLNRVPEQTRRLYQTRKVKQ